MLETARSQTTERIKSGESRRMSHLRTLLLAAAGMIAGLAPLGAAEFTYNDKVNQDIAKKLDIPVYFALPGSARVGLPKTINTTDRLIEFKHPAAKDNPANIGLRIVGAKRAGFSKRMAQSGLIQTGDVLLTFRPEWGGAGAYPNVQLGISHTGIAYVKDGSVYQLDNPMDAEFLGPQFKGDFTSSHYREIKYIHVVRPRNLTEAQKAALTEWASRLTSGARKIYPAQISFNSDYNAPKYESGKPLTFVKHLGQSALNQGPTGQVGMYCSEFVWSLLALRNCDPAKTGEAFKGGSVPSCVSPVMEPMHVTGDYASLRTRIANLGLADGPLMIIDAMKLPDGPRNELIHQLFVDNPAKAAKMSSGHRDVAKTMQPKFEPLEQYYKISVAGGFHRVQAYVASTAIRRSLPDNYSPTSYLINTLLPPGNSHRVMDYVATIMFE